MGGGGVMRSVAKAAGIGISSAGSLRGRQSIPTGENIVSTAARKASRPVAAIVSSHDGENNGEVVNPVQRPSWELEDWEFSGYDEELTLIAPDPLPRVVFGGVPTIDEAKEATLELKDALEKVYLKSPNSARSEDSFSVNQGISLPEFHSNISDSKAYVTCETAGTTYAVHAFKFLNESPAAQSVVASIACDKNVWNAVMQNEELTKYLQSHHTSVSLPENDTDEIKPVAFGDSGVNDRPNETENLGADFSSFIKNVKWTVIDLFSNLSAFVQKAYGDFITGKKSKNGDANFVDTTVLGSSILGLAVLTIMIVVLKRV